VAALFNPNLATAAPSYFSLLELTATMLGVQLSKVPFRTPLEIVRAIDAFAAEPNGGIFLMPPVPAAANLDMVVELAAQHLLPTSGVTRSDVEAGGLFSYSQISAEQYRGAASYVDRLLRGTKIADLPVQFPTKFELVINLKTAKAIKLTIPEAILLRADELIE
jgi:putative ABC transport system substrate-binding protein